MKTTLPDSDRWAINSKLTEAVASHVESKSGGSGRVADIVGPTDVPTPPGKSEYGRDDDVEMGCFEVADLD